MEKVSAMNLAFLNARKEKNKLAIGVLSSLKGEYENSVKNGNPPGDATLEKMVKKFIKNLEIVGTEESKQEINIIKPYGAEEIDLIKLTETIRGILSNNVDKVNAYKSGNNGVIGFLVGCVMKEVNNVDGKVVMEILKQEIGK
jgi:hypothetical protein